MQCFLQTSPPINVSVVDIDFSVREIQQHFDDCLAAGVTGALIAILTRVVLCIQVYHSIWKLQKSLDHRHSSILASQSESRAIGTRMFLDVFNEEGKTCLGLLR